MNQHNDLRTVLREAVEAGEPPVGAGPATVFARAGRIRTRYRFGVVLGVVTTTGLVAAVTSMALAGSPGGQVAAPPVASTPVPTSSLPAASGAAGSPRAAEPPNGPAAQALLTTLRGLLPPGPVASEPFGQPGFAELVLTDARGRGKLMINVQADFLAGGSPDKGASADRFACATRTMPAGTSCTATTLTDGTRLIATSGPAETGHDRVELRQVDLLRPDGVRVVISTWNAVQPKSNVATRPEPMLTLVQLQAIAVSPAWTG